MAKGDDSHIDKLEQYMAEHIDLSDVQTEADLKRAILDLYERERKAGKSANGIRNYARNDWQNKPTAGNWYQATLDEVQKGQKEAIAALERVNDIDGLQAFDAEYKVDKQPENVKNAYRLTQERVYGTQIARVRDYDDLRRFNSKYKPADFPANVKEIYATKQREIKDEADKIYNAKWQLLEEYSIQDPNTAAWKDDRDFKTDGSIDLSSVEKDLSREQYASLRKEFNNVADELARLRGERDAKARIEKIEGDRPYKIVGRKYRKEKYHLATGGKYNKPIPD